MKRPISCQLERIAKDIANSYEEIFGQFSEKEIREIKKPVLELLPLHQMWVTYIHMLMWNPYRTRNKKRLNQDLRSLF